MRSTHSYTGPTQLVKTKGSASGPWLKPGPVNKETTEYVEIPSREFSNLTLGSARRDCYAC